MEINNKEVHPNNYCVIMAGGIGSRFWPMSRTAFPKQFLDILGLGQTLIQMTYQRFLRVCPPENIMVVTNREYADLVLEQLPDLHKEQLILEPMRRNTAPCIAYANLKIAARNPEARIVVAPSDHLITREEDFTETILLALDFCANNNNLITLGIKPSRPDTGYGYIQFIDEDAHPDSRVRKVKTFTEKPDLDIAKQFLKSGDFYWNSGIFIWSLKAIEEAMQTHLSELNELFNEAAPSINTDEEALRMEKLYTVCENISIDYGVLEKAENVNVVLSDFGWSDLGTWGSLYTHLNKDERGNSTLGGKLMLLDAAGNLIKAPSGKLVVLQGLENHIVIDTGDVLMVCPLSEEQKIKHIVNDLKLNKGDAFV